MIILKHIANTVLTVMLLIGTMGFSVDKHYCMDRLMDLAINDHAKTCSGPDFEDPMPCCEDETDALRVEEIATVSFDFDAQPDLFVLTSYFYNVPIAELVLPKANQLLTYTDTSPPFADADLQVRLQVFIL